MAPTFISYRREDSAGYAGRLHEELEERLGPDQVFRDVDTLRPGQDFIDAIESRLRNCGALVAMIGRYWLSATDETGARRIDQAGDYVALEIGAALARPDVLVVPVLVGGAVMPGMHQLPEPLRGLGRRQALILRDETWEQDVDRLAAVLRAHGVGAPRPARSESLVKRQPPWAWIAGAVIVAAIALVAFVYTREPVVDPAGAVGGSVASAVPESPAIPPGPVGSGYAIGIVGNPEFATGETIYSVTTGSLVNNGPTSTLSLRVRVANDSRFSALFGSDAFRLAIGGESLVPSSSFSEALASNATSQRVVTFEIPTATVRADLRIAAGTDAGTMPLDLRPSRRPPAHEQPDTSDPQSRATVATLKRDPLPLLTVDELSSVVQRVTSRRFVNLNRITVTVRYENRGRFDRVHGDIALRMLVGSDVAAPVKVPAQLVASMSTMTGDTVFDVPPGARSVTLRATGGQLKNELALTLP